MNVIDKDIKEIVDTDFRQYAMYVLENRAIPSVIDGFKPVHRKLVYSMLNNYAGKKVKISDLGGISCVTGDTLVVHNGQERQICDVVESFKTGDTILAYDEQQETYVQANLLDAFETKKVFDYLTIVVEGGVTLELTPDHRVLTTLGWSRADTLTLDHKILCQFGEARILGIHENWLELSVPVYDVTTSTGTFCATRAKLVIHNCYNYHHGESSAMGAAITLSQDWNNNVPVFTSHGNFGSRLIQEAAAPRYIYATLSKEFSKFFVDSEVAPKSFDPDNPEPAFYLPIIPWVLVNGISGIAVGFATNILPRSTESIAQAVKKCLVDPGSYLTADEPITPTFPSFRGAVEQIGPNQWKTSGLIESTKGTEYLITELPIGYDRESYISFLNTLSDTDKIRDYHDECSEAGFQFRIKVSASQKNVLEKDLMKSFKLEKTHSENLTTLGTDGKLKIFDSVAQLVHYFVEQRTKYFGLKIDNDIRVSSDKIAQMTDKIKFIESVISGEVDFKKMTKSQLTDFVKDRITKEPHGQSFIRIPLYECTTDVIDELRASQEKQLKILEALKNMTPKKLFGTHLKAL